MADDIGPDWRDLDLVVFADQLLGRLWSEPSAALFADLGPIVAKFIGVSASARLWGSCPGFAPPGRDASRFAFLSVDGGLEELRDVFSGR